MSWIFLALAILFEVIATSALKASHGCTRLIPSVLAVLGYCTAFYLLSLCLRTIPVGIAYAVWAGVGIVAIALIGRVLYDQKLDIPAFVGMGFIMTGVLILNVFSKTSTHS